MGGKNTDFMLPFRTTSSAAYCCLLFVLKYAVIRFGNVCSLVNVCIFLLLAGASAAVVASSYRAYAMYTPCRQPASSSLDTQA